jgi:hypothetical protein
LSAALIPVKSFAIAGSTPAGEEAGFGWAVRETAASARPATTAHGRTYPRSNIPPACYSFAFIAPREASTHRGDPAFIPEA